MKRILLLVDVFAVITGGAERQIFELCRRLDKNKYKLTVACLSSKGRLLKEVEAFGVTTQRLDVGRIYGMNGLRRGFRFRDFLKNERIDVVMTFHFASDIWGTVFARLAGVPRIISCRRDMGFWKQNSHRRAYRFINRWVSRFIVVADAIKQAIIKDEGVRPEKIEVIYNGIDPSQAMEPPNPPTKRAELNLPPQGKLVGCVGNLRAVKGQHDFIEAASEIAQDMPDTAFLIIGGPQSHEPGLPRQLKAHVRQRHLQDKVFFLGKRGDARDIITLMDVCVLPSLSEGLSNTLLEYMLCGRPVVATAVGGNPEAVRDGANGLLVPPNDHHALADKVALLLRDEDLAARLGRQAQQDVIAKFDMDNMIRQYEQVLDADEAGHD